MDYGDVDAGASNATTSPPTSPRADRLGRLERNVEKMMQTLLSLQQAAHGQVETIAHRRRSTTVDVTSLPNNVGPSYKDLKELILPFTGLDRTEKPYFIDRVKFS